ncbi:response regulator transcription factor [Mobilitalea sibirica]|uniref:Stage 0 sporulation protein A homolog n=1 Tax=Mobilitalea sibirica TaxID=1462919 RepID=A0A8J7KX14_9FIRM|nr:response regulator transcription factor [Mobilitalea sibirica]MBH1941950.1 response regulator transcription factor [Mobilitalea sibirica]
MERIYVIEDDENIRDLLKVALEGFGYKIMAYEAAEPALENMKTEKPDMAIFDIMLPGMDGLTAIKNIRQDSKLKNIPIICLTAKDKELDKVIGLDVGADDYITKPFGVLELTARIRSLLRRSVKKENDDLYTIGTLTINPSTREVINGGREIELTFKEYELLIYLIENSARVVSRDELLNQIWGYEYDGESRTLDIHIRTLRQKLGRIGTECIKTIRSVGYRFVRTGE